MGAFASEGKALKAAFIAGWASYASTYPVKYDGSPFTQPSGAWVAFFVLRGDGERLELGTGGLSRYPGLVMVQIFVPESGGIRLAEDIGDLVKGVFHEQPFTTESGGRILCRQTSLRRAGQEKALLQFNAVTPYQRDEA